MSLIRYPDSLDRFFDRNLSLPFSLLRDMEDWQRDVTPYWRGKRGMLEFARDEVVTDENRLAINVDVSSFHPSELNVSIDGQELVVKGCHEETGENSSMHREFVRRYRIPEDVDPAQIRSALSQEGKLTIEVPKKNAALQSTRTIPIEYSKI